MPFLDGCVDKCFTIFYFPRTNILLIIKIICEGVSIPNSEILNYSCHFSSYDSVSALKQNLKFYKFCFTLTLAISTTSVKDAIFLTGI